MISWVDSSHGSGWRNEDSAPMDDKTIEILSCGFFRGNSDLCLHFVQSYGVVPFDDGSTNIDARMEIPWCAIKKITKIKT